MKCLRQLWAWLNRSLQRKLVVWTTVFWIVSVSALSLTLIFTTQARMIDEANRRNTQLASVISRDINARISAITSDVRFFAMHLQGIPGNLDSQASALLALRQSSPQRYRAVYYFDVQGQELFYLTENRQALSQISIHDILIRPNGEVPEVVTEAYRQVNGSFFASGVSFTALDQAPVMYMGIPVEQDSGRTTAIIELDLQDIWQNIDLMTVGQSGITYMVASDGTILAHPEKAYVNRPIPAELNKFLPGSEGYAEYIEPFRKTAVLSAFSPVGGPTGWGIVIQQDKSEAYQAVGQAVGWGVGIWSVLALMGTIGISIAARQFTKPIADLTKTAKYIAQTGELTRTAMTQKSDEIGQLSQAFDNMIGKLESAEGEIKQAQGELENRVTIRTAELTETNERLTDEMSQRELAEKALRESETKYRHLIQNATTIILEMDTRGRVTFFNQFAEHFFGFTESEILGRSVVGTIVPEKDQTGTDLNTMIDDLSQNPERYRHNENENIKKNGERVWIVWSNQPLYDEAGNLGRILCVGMDMTEQKRLEAIADQQAQERAAIAERTRLARDLHDAVSQTLFSASLIADVLPKIWEKNPEDGRRRLEEIRQLTRGALAEMRTLLFELRPAALADADLRDLLRQLAESVTSRARVPVATNLQGQCTLEPDTKIALYRIAQEALNNVAKHSGASQAQVAMDSQPGRVSICIKDNGKGFLMSDVKGNSLGLGIMKERAKAIGAILDIRSNSGQGTEVNIIWDDSIEEADND